MTNFTPKPQNSTDSLDCFCKPRDTRQSIYIQNRSNDPFELIRIPAETPEKIDTFVFIDHEFNTGL